jgi:hypothetical protein
MNQSNAGAIPTLFEKKMEFFYALDKSFYFLFYSLQALNHKFNQIHFLYFLV